MKKLLIGFLLSIFLCGTSFAYQVGFDQEGAGVFNVGTSELTSDYYDQLTFSGTSMQEVPGGTGSAYDVVSYQEWVGSNLVFQENFTVELTEGDNLSPGYAGDTDFATGFISGAGAYYSTYATISLTGIVSPTSTYFTDGSITIYYDTDIDGDITTGTQATVATLGLDLEQNNFMTLGSTNLGTTSGTEGDLTLNFVFLETEFDPAYDFWSDEVDELTNVSWLLALVNEGDVTMQENALDGNNEGYVGWSFGSLTAEFSVVPEPATMLLFGLGLIGLAGIGRRRA